MVVKYLMVILILIPSVINIAAYGASSEIAQVEQSIYPAKKFSQVSLVYYKNFPYPATMLYHPVTGCLPIHKYVKNKQNNRSYLLHCKERVKFLLPTYQATIWQEKQKHQGCIYLNLPSRKMVIHPVDTTIHAHIVSIKPVHLNNIALRKDAHPVTAVFIRHAEGVKTYRFKNLKTGIINTINATDNHPFYLGNKGVFVPISRVSTSDVLITDTGQPVRLICANKNRNICGVPYNKGRLSTVYNIEVDTTHTYFVGESSHILVHNCSGKRGKEKIETCITAESIPRKMAVRLLGEDGAGRGGAPDEGYYSLACIRQLHIRENLRNVTGDSILDPMTQTRVIRIQDSHLNEFDISEVHYLRQDRAGRLQPAKRLRGWLHSKWQRDVTKWEQGLLRDAEQRVEEMVRLSMRRERELAEEERNREAANRALAESRNWARQLLQSGQDIDPVTWGRIDNLLYR